MAVPVVGLAFSMSYPRMISNCRAKHGVKMKTVEISGIGAMNSVIAGSTDFTQSSGGALARAAARGQRLLAIVETRDRPFAQVVLRKELGGGFRPQGAAEKARAGAARQDHRGRRHWTFSTIHAYVRLMAKRAGF